MKLKNNRLLIIIIFLILNILNQKEIFATTSEKRGCAICHSRWIEESGPLERLKKLGVLLVDDIDTRLAADEDICYGCHDGSVLDSRAKIRKYMETRHPIDVVPSKNIVIPQNFPLDKNGKLYCGTCHSAHGGLETESEVDVEKGTFLRYPNKNSKLCVMCHVDKLGGRSAGMHPIDVNSLPISKRIVDNGGEIGTEKPNQVICESCHIVHGSPYEKLLVLSNGIGSGAKSSDLCEACHKDNPSIAGHGPGMDSHPVNVVAQVAVIPDRWESGKKAIKTDDNRVICRSCHTPHGAVKGTPLLEYVGETKENYKNFLCKQCHADKIGTGKMGENTGTHPVDLLAPDAMKPEAKLPFDKDRKLMCISCHMPHNAADGSASDGSDGKILRVTNKDSLLCKECHDEKYAKGIEDAEKNGMHPILVKPKDVVLDDAIKKGGQIGSEGVIVCSSCHNIHKGKKGTPILIETNVDSKICEVCHQSKLFNEDDKTITSIKHPVGRKPNKVKIPKEIYDAGGKLGENGEIICAICHKPHNSIKNTPLLIMENEKNSMCMLCHVDKKTVKASDHNMDILAPTAKNLRDQTVAEAGVCSACHFSHQWARPLDGNGDLSKQFCVSCHSDNKPGEKKPIGGYTHPTDVNIKKVGDGTTSLPVFRDRGAGKSWENSGKVLCTSCHDPHIWTPDKEENEEDHMKNVEGNATNSFLRKANDSKSSLCLDCHKDKNFIVDSEHDLNITNPTGKNILGQTASEAGLCSACHLPHNGTLRRMWARQVSGKEDPGSQLCKSCHSKGNPGEKKLLTSLFTHPVNANIKNADGTTTLPLVTPDGSIDSKEGKVICYSCHDPHKWDPTQEKSGPGKNIEGNGDNSFLRLRSDYELTLCADCHEDKKNILKTDHDLTITAPESRNKDGFRAQESGPCLVCHSIHNGVDDKMWNRDIDNKKMDVVSKLCISCHSKGKVGEAKLVGELSHPVDKTILAVDNIPDPNQYPTYTATGERTSKGKVFCSSCHNLHQWDPDKKEVGPGKNEEGDGNNSFLRKKNVNSELCLECHGKKKLLIRTKHDMSLFAPESKNIIGQNAKRSGVCGACHVPHNAADYRLWARLPSEGDDLGTVLCLSCHSKDRVGQKKTVGLNSHPVNVTFEGSLKVDGSTNFPLYDENGIGFASSGKVICMSCHDVHKWNPSKDEYGDGQLAEGDGSNSFLRRANDNKAELCLDCHGDKSFIVGTDHDLSVTAPNEKNYLGQAVSQTGPCGVCHVPHNAYVKARLFARVPGVNSENRQMDVMAALCYSCHQTGSVGGSKVPEVLFHPPQILVSMVGRGEKGKGSYWPVYNMLGDLVGSGMITCPTCHNLHKWQPDLDKPGNGKNIEGDATNSFLRNKGASFSLCTDCHESDAIMRYKYYHIERNRLEHRGNVH